MEDNPIHVRFEGKVMLADLPALSAALKTALPKVALGASFSRDTLVAHLASGASAEDVMQAKTILLQHVADAPAIASAKIEADLLKQSARADLLSALSDDGWKALTAEEKVETLRLALRMFARLD